VERIINAIQYRRCVNYSKQYSQHIFFYLISNNIIDILLSSLNFSFFFKGTLKLITKLISNDGSGQLLGQIVGEMGAGGSVSLEFKGTTSINNVPGRGNATVVSPIDVVLLLPRVVEVNISQTIERSDEETNKLITDTVRSIHLQGLSTKSSLIDLPCIMGTSATRCNNMNDINAAAQQLHLRSTVTFALQHALASNMDVQVTLPSITATASVFLSDTPLIERSFGKVALEGFHFQALHNDSIGAVVEVGVTDASVLRTVYKASDKATENMTVVVKGFNKTVDNSDDRSVPTLLEKMLVHLEYRRTLVPSDYNAQASSSSSSTTTKELNSLLTLKATHESTTSATLYAEYKVSKKDSPVWLPPIKCDSMSLSILSGAGTTSNGGDGAVALTVNVPEFLLNKTDGATISVTMTTKGNKQFAATRSIVSAFRKKDVTNNIVVKGSIGGSNNALNVRLKIGQTDYESVRKKLKNDTTFEIKNVNLVGGSSVGSPIRVPCIMDTVCPGTLDSLDESTAFSFYSEYLLKIEGLPCHLVVSIDSFDIGLDDNTHTEFIRVVAPNTMTYDSRINHLIQGIHVRVHIDSGTRARDVIRSIGGIDYRLHLHGEGTTNALSGLWQPSDSYLIKIGSDAGDPNSAESVPKWYFPLKTTNTWTLDSTSNTRAEFSINNFPINWPMTFPLDINQPKIDVIYQKGSKQPVTVANAILKNPANGQPMNLNLLSNTTDQRHWIKLILFGDSTNGPSYCRSGITYIETSKCAISEVVYHVLTNEIMTIQLNYQYSIPLGIGGGVAGTAVAGTFKMELNDNYWSSEWSRTQDAWALNEWVSFSCCYLLEVVVVVVNFIL
jgi:hypothetical protein